MLIVLPSWSLLVHGRRHAIRLIGWMAGTGVVISATLLSFFGVEGVLFNTVTIPSRVPWQPPGRLFAGFSAGAELVANCAPLLMLLMLGGVTSYALRFDPYTSRTTPGRFLAGQPWALLAVVALSMVPVSVLGRAKVGGSLNTLSPTTYFLLAAGILSLIGLTDRLKVRGSPESHQVSLGLVALCSLVLAAGGVFQVRVLVRGTPLSEHRTEVAYQYLVREDSNAYFPNHPLAHLLSNGALFHLAESLYDREVLANLPLSDEQRMAHLPSNPSVVCWNPSWGVEYVRANYFVEYDNYVAPPALSPSFECYTK